MSTGSPFDRPGPRWFTIPAHRPFVEDLAQGLHDALAPLGPDALSQAIVLTPTRRGARSLAEGFLKAAGGRAVLLPQIRAIGDLDEGEPPFEPGDLALDLLPAVSAYRRRFELARLVAENASMFDRPIDAPAALELADALAAFLDSCQIEEVDDPGAIETLVEGDMARHWLRSAAFLELATRHWPARLAELGLSDVTERRVRLLRELARQWTDNPPQGVLIAAGSTGTAPATADLLRVIAGAPQGAVVLPGLDVDLADDAWIHVSEQHPQGAMKRLLEAAGMARQDVLTWPVRAQAGEARGRWRRRIINEALRPADATADWRDQIDAIRKEAAGTDPIAEGLAGLSVAAGRSEEETAVFAALLMREALETPGKTCALVTPDRDLARRVSARLARWGVSADSSAGAPLSGCGCGVLAGLVARGMAEPTDPVRLLAILKHPMVRLGLAPEDLESARRALELHGLRGARRDGWPTLLRQLDKAAEKNPDAVAEAAALAGRLKAVFDAAQAPFAGGDAAVPDAARALVEAIEVLAQDTQGRLGDLWAGSSGEAAAGLFSALIDESGGLPPATPSGFAALLETLMQGAAVRSGGASHPRLRILGAIEARLVRADRLILAGLEEGVWPQPAPTDPFLSRPMRKSLGLPPPERRIGLSAHDFAQAACAPEVILLHSERRGGAPAVESRWLWRLRTLAKGAGLALPERPELHAWAQALDAADGYQPSERPHPTPPVSARPTKLAVTRVEALTRDPYAVYARDILKLYPLDRPDAPVEARARGTAIHAAFEQFAEAYPEDLPDDAADQFKALYLQALRDAGAPASAMTREEALAREAAAWVADLETRRRAEGIELLIEAEGRLPLQVGHRTITLTAKADRIELTRDGRGHVLDFKTGAPPSEKMVRTGFSPQLTLTAAILARGGFAVGPRQPGDLIYLRVSGRIPAGEETLAVKDTPTDILAEEAMDGLMQLLQRYEDPAQPYWSRTAPQFVKTYASDYDHLARVYEWSTAGEEDE